MTPIARATTLDAASLLEATDWAATRLGPRAGWPAALRILVRTVVDADAPMFVAWGAELAMVCNDAFASQVLGTDRLPPFGQPLASVWPQAWATLAPRVQRALDGEAAWLQEQRFEFKAESNDHAAEAWFTYSLSPLRDEQDHVQGILGIFARKTERVLAQRSSDNSLQALYQLMEQAPSFMAVVQGPRHTYQFANRAYRDFVGMPDVVGRTVLEVMPEMAAQRFVEFLDGALASGQPVVGRRIPAMLRDAAGAMRQRFVDFMLQPMREGDGPVQGVLIDGYDVTEAKLYEDELRAGEAKLRTMTEALPQLVWATSAQGVDEFRNATWYEFTGLPRGQMNPEIGMQLVHEEDMPRVRAVWAHCVATGEPYQSEYRLRHHSGEYRWVLARALPLRDAGGAIERWLGTATDIHDHKLLEADLRDTRRRLQGALAAAEIGTWSWDLKADRIWGDRNCAQLFGLSAADAAGGLAQVYLSRIHPDDLATTRAAVDQSLRTGQPYQDSFRVRLPGGGWRHIHARAKVEFDGQGRPAWLPGVALDVTREKLAEEALRLADRRKDEFLATLAHELRNPLAPIANAAAIIPRVKTDADKVERLAAVIERQARHMTGLVEDLLDVSRVTRGQVTLKMERVALRDVLLEALEQVQPQAAAKQQHLSTSLSDESLAVSGDKKRLVQVLVNLLTNAVRYTPAGGAIGVHVRAEGPRVMLRVDDSGIGMNEELCRSAFELFTQGTRAADRSQGGLGIGLALVKTLVELHGGQVRASSAGPGLGSSFEVTLARLDPTAAERESPAPRSLHSRP